MTTAREAAFAVLRRWAVITEPPFLPERGTWGDVSPRDRAFAFDLLTGVMRWRGTLDAVIASRLKQPLQTLDIDVQAILWLGAYQLLLQEGVAEYAAVDTSVELARRHASRAGGLVNAVLRGIGRLLPVRVPTVANASLSRRAFALDAATDLRFNADVFPDPARALAAHLAVVRSHPRTYVDHLIALFGPDRAGGILLGDNQRPAITLRSDAAEVDVPAAAGLKAHPSAERFLIAGAGWNDVVEGLVKKGVLSPQDATAAKPVRAAARLVAEGSLGKPARMLDLCAGLGTKSLQLARAFPETTIVAADVDTVKLQRLAARAKEVKQGNIETLPLDAEGVKIKEQPGADKTLVLVDVPCSNTGVFAKRVQSRWRWPTLDRAALGALQMKLLEQGAEHASGALIYSTCSIDPAENEQRVAAFCAAHKEFKIVQVETTMPSANPEAPGDGGYFAILTR